MQPYLLNIDWLTIYGTQAMPLDEAKAAPDVYRSPSMDKPDIPASKNERISSEQAAVTVAAIKRRHIGSVMLEVQPYGTAQFSMMAKVYLSREEFGTLLAFPRISTLPRNAMSFKVTNRWLYMPDWRAKLQFVFAALRLQARSISRLDIAADFNLFNCGLHPIEFIRQFMAGEIKHKGRGAGHVDFVQRYAYIQRQNKLIDTLNFNALTIGKKSSDAHCYLYNKSLELEQIKMKPWIVDCWRHAGFDVDDVWRLEVTCKAKALRFRSRRDDKFVELTFDDLISGNSMVYLNDFYMMMIRSLFFFFYPTGQRNVSREKMMDLFGYKVDIDRGVVRFQNPSNRTERILIKQLYTLMNTYRGITMQEGFDAQSISMHLIDTMDLHHWAAKKIDTWKNDKFKV